MSGTCDIDYGDASFRDIVFEVFPVQDTIGRRIITSVYPYSGKHFNEDIGALPESFTVSGAFIGEDARDKLTVAKRIWVVEGDGVFFEPTENKSHEVRLLKVVFDYQNTKINYIPFTIEFISTGRNPYPTQADNIADQASAAVDNYITNVNDFYVNSAFNSGFDFSDVISAFGIISEFLFDIARSNVSTNFNSVSSRLRNLTPSPAADVTVRNVVDVFEYIISQENIPSSFFEQVSETRVLGNETQELQGVVIALIGLGYHFEVISNEVQGNPLEDSSVDYLALRRFRDRAISLKKVVSDTKISSDIDVLILQLGRLTSQTVSKTKDGPEHALVASYELFGNISQATAITQKSYGISGARLNPVRYNG